MPSGFITVVFKYLISLTFKLITIIKYMKITIITQDIHTRDGVFVGVRLLYRKRDRMYKYYFACNKLVLLFL